MTLPFHRRENTPQFSTVWGTCQGCKKECHADKKEYNDGTVWYTCQECGARDQFIEHEPTHGAGLRGKRADKPLSGWNDPFFLYKEIQVEPPPQNPIERIKWAIKRVRDQERKQELRRQEQQRLRSFLDRATQRPDPPPSPKEEPIQGDVTSRQSYYCPACEKKVMATVVENLSARKKKLTKPTAYCPDCGLKLQERYKK